MTYKSNYTFYITETLTKNAMTVTISKDIETNSIVELPTSSFIVAQNEDGTIIERMRGTATNNTLTLTLRGLLNDDTLTSSTPLKKQRERGTKLFVSVGPHQLPEKSGTNIWSGTNTMTGEFIINGEFYFPELTTAQRDAITWNRDGAFIKNTTTGTNQQRIGGAWVDIGTSTTPNASPTVAGKVEIATQAQVDSGISIGETGALLSATPDTIAITTQSNKWIRGVDQAIGTDSYVVLLNPTPTAYTEGMEIFLDTQTSNTGACTIDVDFLGPKNIKTIEGNDPVSGEIAVGANTKLRYDGTNFVIVDPCKRASDVEYFAGTATSKVPTIAQVGYTIVGGTTLLASSNSFVNVTTATYAKYKDIDVGIGGTYTVTFTIGTGATTGLFARIYKNGVAVGTERNISASTTQTYSEEITVANTDNIQLYAYYTGSQNNPNISRFEIAFGLKPRVMTSTVVL